jgi:hypothetical protein
MIAPYDNPWEIPGINARLVELHASDLTMRAIADRLSFEFEREIGRNSVIGRCRRLGLANRPNVPPPGRKVKVKVKKVVVDAPIAPEPEPAPRHGLTIYQLKDGVCKWPLGEVEARPPYFYCGEFAEEGCSYCGEHHVKAHGAPARVVWT